VARSVTRNNVTHKFLARVSKIYFRAKLGQNPQNFRVNFEVFCLHFAGFWGWVCGHGKFPYLGHNYGKVVDFWGCFQNRAKLGQNPQFFG